MSKLFLIVIVAGLVLGMVQALPRQTTIGLPRIAGGHPAEPGSVPHQVSVQYYSQHLCGGSIISPDFIISAAHCGVIADASTFTIRAGVHNIDEPEAVSQEVQVAEKMVHAGYDDESFENDICLLRLASPLKLGEEYRTAAILMADTGYDASGTATVTGWGSSSNAGAPPSELHTVDLPIVTDARCTESYGQGEITDSMICAGLEEGGVGSCQGDSGGPLYLKDGPLLVGIVSFGVGCGQPGYFGVYTEVSHFREWIRINSGV